MGGGFFMTRIGVLSDSHGSVTNAQQALARMGEIQYLFHAGDYARDVARLAFPSQVVVHAVCGNCDASSGQQDEELVAMEGVRILLTHGHTYRVKFGLYTLSCRAAELQADVVVYGHTHVAEYQYEGGILFFNPGSITNPRDGRGFGYGILEIKGRNITPFLRKL